MKNYKQIFFDLDRTLWDFQKNSSEALLDILEQFKLHKVIKNEHEFIEKYNYFNDHLWDDLKAGKIKKSALRSERFRLLLDHFGIQNPELVSRINRYYLNITPVKTGLVPGAKETLKYLYAKYKLHIISNGFHDVQVTKLISSGISRYFDKVFTSDMIGYAKPRPEIFNHAISSVNVKKVETLMVGDDLENDVYGAKAARIDQVFYNPEKKSYPVAPTYTIESLAELKTIL